MSSQYLSASKLAARTSTSVQILLLFPVEAVMFPQEVLEHLPAARFHQRQYVPQVL